MRRGYRAVCRCRFNTQPPEGGWAKRGLAVGLFDGFNTQPPEGGWFCGGAACSYPAAFQHTAARRRLETSIRSFGYRFEVSTHSRPKAAGKLTTVRPLFTMFQHTAARRRLA